jgi:hypothetical protein
VRPYASAEWYRSFSERLPGGQRPGTYGYMTEPRSLTWKKPIAWPTSCITIAPLILLLPQEHRSSTSSISPSVEPTYALPQYAQLLVDTGSRDLVLFKSRMPASLLPVPWTGDKVIQLPAGLARLLRYDLRQVTLGDQRWESLPGFVLGASTSSYPAGIDGVLGVRAVGGARVRLDFERRELGWSE